MDFQHALQEWRRAGGVLEALGPDYRSWTVRGVLEGEDWQQTCRFALREAGWTGDRVDNEFAGF